eukprot:s1044_g12.t1
MPILMGKVMITGFAAYFQGQDSNIQKPPGTVLGFFRKKLFFLSRFSVQLDELLGFRRGQTFLNRGPGHAFVGPMTFSRRLQ